MDIAFFTRKKILMILSWFFFSSVYSISDKHGRHNSRELSKEDFLEFKSILLYYIDFCQKQKVCVIHSFVRLFINFSGFQHHKLTDVSLA